MQKSAAATKKTEDRGSALCRIVHAVPFGPFVGGNINVAKIAKHLLFYVLLTLSCILGKVGSFPLGRVGPAPLRP